MRAARPRTRILGNVASVGFSSRPCFTLMINPINGIYSLFPSSHRLRAGGYGAPAWRQRNSSGQCPRSTRVWLGASSTVATPHYIPSEVQCSAVNGNEARE